jgi:hypothetical protein
VKALTVRQPWASLIVAGVKTVETRPRRITYRGRVAIHAAKHPPEFGDTVGHWHVCGGPETLVPAFCLEEHRYDGSLHRKVVTDRIDPLPLGAVVGSAVLTDCVPIVAALPAQDTWREPWKVVVAPPDSGLLHLHWWRGFGSAEGNWLDQRPYGDFTPGRWALLLEDAKPTTERCPWCWGEAEVPCQAHSIRNDACFACWNGEPCPVCDPGWASRRAGRCDPIPARGQLAVPWNWDGKRANMAGDANPTEDR